ncbi:hypothetical protein D3C72_1735620 [compost metagenome]
MFPKNIPNIKLNVTVETNQLRDRNTLRSITGSTSVNSQIIKIMRLTTEITAQVVIIGEENQSSSLPLSIMN